MIPPALLSALIVFVLLVFSGLTLGGCDAADKSHSLTLMNQGVGHFNEASYPKAVEKLTEATQVWPKNDKAFFMLGQIYQFKYMQPDKAITNYDSASSIVPDSASYLYFKGSCLAEVDRNEEAEVALTKAVGLEEKHADAHYRLGLLFEKKGEPIKAAKAYGASVLSNPLKPFAYYNLGDLYFRNDKLEEARRVFKNGTENNPKHAELHHGLGVAYLSLTRHREALIEFEEALSLKAVYPSAVYNIGMTYLALGEMTKAKSYLENFVKLAGGEDNAARIAAAEARLLEIHEAEKKR
jgi:tetratricopeptide (TPR) repeat protein